MNLWPLHVLTPNLRRLGPLGLALAGGASIGTAQQQSWLQQFGTSSMEYATAAAPATGGGAFFAGPASGALLGSHAGSTDVWLLRRGPDGSAVWQTQLGSSGSDFVRAAVEDGAGGVYLTGETSASFGGPSAGGSDAWVARIDANGQQMWIRQLGTATAEISFAAATDGAGGVYVAGTTTGALGGGHAGLSDGWLARYLPDGNLAWVRQYGSSANDSIEGLAEDGVGGVIVSGTTGGSLGAPSAGEDDVWFARYDANGTQVWRNQIGTNTIDFCKSAASDGMGGCFIGGTTYGVLGSASAGGPDGWVGRVDATGAVLWLEQFGTWNWDQLDRLASDGTGGAYAGGISLDSLFGPYTGDGISSDVWLARFDASGTRTWETQFGTFEYEYLFALAPDGSDGLLAGGWTEGNLAGPHAAFADVWIGRWGNDCPPVTTYCSASATSIAGCSALLSTTGAPRLQNPQSFTIQTSGVPAVNVGLCLFAANGPASLPFGTLGGILCVQPPAFRTAAKSSGGGVVPCDGAYSFTLQNLVSAAPIVTVGATLNAQVWARDPANPDGFLLSDAVEFVVCP